LVIDTWKACSIDQIVIVLTSKTNLIILTAITTCTTGKASIKTVIIRRIMARWTILTDCSI